MKAAVTGHSGGLGKAIADRLARDGHEIRGFSLEDGYDISTPDGFRRIVTEALDCDVFVNCAHDRKNHGIGQVNVLCKLFYHWQNEEKHIVNIGSNAPDVYNREVLPLASRYRASKAALDAAVVELNQMRKACRVSLVRPNWIDSAASAEREKDTGFTLLKLNGDEVADVVSKIIEWGPRVTIQSITLARSVPKPPKPTQVNRLKRWLRNRWR
jgi:short-subunit dehydrogenase